MSTQQTTDAELRQIVIRNLLATPDENMITYDDLACAVLSGVMPIIDGRITHARAEGRREGRLEAVRHLIYLAQQHPDGTVNIPTMEIEIEDDTGAAAETSDATEVGR